MSTAPTKYDTDWFTDADELGTESGLGQRDDSAKSRAEKLIDAFRKGRGNRHWPALQRKKVARGLQYRLDHPDAFDQGQTFLCGVASFVRVWAYDHPVEYVQLAIDLFEKGTSRLVGTKAHAGKEVTPSRLLKQSSIASRGGGKNLNHADWIVLGSVREALNHVWAYTSNEGPFNIRGWNFASDIEREFRYAGYTRIVNKADGLGGGGYDNLCEASRLYEQNWRVILLINMELLDAKSIGSNVWRSDHWVGLNSRIFTSNFNNRIRVYPFSVYSWNRLYRVPRWNKPMSFADFNDKYFGFVAGKH